MRTFPLTLALAGLSLCTSLVPAPLAAQSIQDRFEVTFQAREAERRAAISRTMLFTEEEAAKFWPIYDRYRLAAKGIQLRQLQVVQRFSENVVGMDEKTANTFLEEGMATEQELLDEKQDFLRKAGAVLSGARYFRLSQVEMRLNAMQLYAVTRQIPLAMTEEERAKLEGLADAPAAQTPQNAATLKPST